MSLLEGKDYNREHQILLVDDDNTLLKFFKIHLNKFYAKVYVVETAKDAVSRVKQGDIDLVISDIRMPKIDGLELMAKLKKADPTIPVFLISGALLTEEQKSFIESEVDGFLKKPFSVEDFHNYINRGLHLRKVYQQLGEIVKNKKNFMDLIHHRMHINEAVKKTALTQAGELLEELKKVG